MVANDPLQLISYCCFNYFTKYNKNYEQKNPNRTGTFAIS